MRGFFETEEAQRRNRMRRDDQAAKQKGVGGRGRVKVRKQTDRSLHPKLYRGLRDMSARDDRRATGGRWRRAKRFSPLPRLCEQAAPDVTPAAPLQKPLDPEGQDRGRPLELFHPAKEFFRCHPLRVVAIEDRPRAGQMPFQFSRVLKATWPLPTKVLGQAVKRVMRGHRYDFLTFLCFWPHQGHVKPPRQMRPPLRRKGAHSPAHALHSTTKRERSTNLIVGFFTRMVALQQ